MYGFNSVGCIKKSFSENSSVVNRYNKLAKYLPTRQ